LHTQVAYAGSFAVTCYIVGYQMTSGVLSIPTTIGTEISNIIGYIGTILTYINGTTGNFSQIAKVTLMATSTANMANLQTTWDNYFGSTLLTTYRPAITSMVVSSLLPNTAATPVPKVSIEVIFVRATTSAASLVYDASLSAASADTATVDTTAVATADVAIDITSSAVDTATAADTSSAADTVGSITAAYDDDDSEPPAKFMKL
jgi:hypothetical protein